MELFFHGASLRLRDATSDDAETLLSWRNDALTRAHSFQTQEVSLDEHCAWLEKVLIDESVRLYILTDGESDLGQVRLETTDEGYLISYDIAPTHRGKGLGKTIIALAVEKTIQAYEGAPDTALTFIARVRTDNPASRRIFLANGFTEEVTGETVVYTKIVRGTDETDDSSR